MSTKNFIDYTHQGDGVNSREALYAAIHDRVAEAINNKKIEIAQNLIGQNESVEELDELSKSTLSGYLQKASGDVQTKTKKAGGEALGNKKIDSRLSGMGKASERLAKEEVNEAREDSPIKGTVKKHTYEQGAHKVEVRYDPEWDDYQVHPYKNGKHMGEGPVSYHGGDKEDAHETAKSVLAHLSK